ncbi:MAG: DUF1800 family protein [Pirellulaceae bacterium]|nr:DUF1800 family protein [Pirellulaceae bacterium]
MKSVEERKQLHRYEATSSMPWNVERVVHLHRRAGFAADWARISIDLLEGPDASIERLLHAKSLPEFEQMSQTIGDAAIGSGDITRLKAWWLYRMLFASDPLNERLTLCWHNHFATSNFKVNDVSLMQGQNDLLRQYSSGNFSELLHAVIRDPAMLVWLDADSNRMEHPNENLARELMELFTLGVGHYSEIDVKESARALTGWTSVRGKFRSDEKLHDAGEKSILGKNGNWDGDDLLKILIEHPATPRRLAFRLCQLFFGESAVTDESVKELAGGLREHDLDIACGETLVVGKPWGHPQIEQGETLLTINASGLVAFS